jgi:DNA-binding transcriptional MerR regulator
MAKARDEIEEENETSEGEPNDESDSEPNDEPNGGGGRGVGRGRGGPGPVPLNKVNPGKLTRAAAAKRLDISVSTLKRYVLEGKLSPPETDTAGHVWYDATEVEDLAEDRQDDELGAKQVIDAANGIIKQQMSHHEAMASTMARMIDETGKREAAFMGAFLKATETILTQQTSLAVAALGRSSKLEGQLDDAREAVGKAMDYNTQREIALSDAAARQKRSDDLVAKLSPHIPTVLSMVGKKFGAPPDVAAQPLIEDLMKSIQPEQAQKLITAGILTEAQLGQLMVLWESFSKGGVDKVEAKVEAEAEAKKETSGI